MNQTVKEALENVRAQLDNSIASVRRDFESAKRSAHGYDQELGELLRKRKAVQDHLNQAAESTVVVDVRAIDTGFGIHDFVYGGDE